jgi:hypothetical protein
MSLNPVRPSKAWSWKLIGFLQIGNAVAFGAVASTVDFSRSAPVDYVASGTADAGGNELGTANGGESESEESPQTSTADVSADAASPLSELVAKASQESTKNPAGSDLPEVVLSGPTIVNPATNSASVRFVVNGDVLELKPGERRTLTGGDSWVVRFHRGGEFGAAYEPIYDGTHQFVIGPRGWSLERAAEAP